MNIGIVSPGHPDSPGGVTDHTSRLVRHWSEAGRKVLVLGSTMVDPHAVVAEWAQAGVGAILIQYVPFLYGRRGLSRFPRRVTIAAKAAGLRTTVFVHEPWVPPTRLPWLVLSPLQRRQLHQLVALCDEVVTPVPAWRALLGRNVSVIYAGSNLGEPPEPGPGEPLAAPVVFSPFASGLRWDWIVAAAQAIGALPQLTIIGADWETANRHPLVKRFADPSWDWRGRLAAPDVLALVARARIVLAPFTDGLTARRGSALAAMSAGAQVVSSRGPLFDPFFDTSPFALASTLSEFCELALSQFVADNLPSRRQRRVAWYRQHLSPTGLDERLLALLLGVRP